jgi:collagen type III alpha
MSETPTPVPLSPNTAMPPPGAELFNTDFMSMDSGVDDMALNLFSGSGDINFERDFGQWFNPDDMVNGMDPMAADR